MESRTLRFGASFGRIEATVSQPAGERAAKYIWRTSTKRPGSCEQTAATTVVARYVRTGVNGVLPAAAQLADGISFVCLGDLCPAQNLTGALTCCSISNSGSVDWISLNDSMSMMIW